MTLIPDDLPAYVLTVHQPWAWAIIHGGKDVENRGWKPTQPCVVLIHAGRAFDFEARRFMRRIGVELPLTSALFERCIIGAVTVRQWTRDSPSPWAIRGQWHWLLENPVALAEPIPLRGRPSLFSPPAGWRERFR